jgi:hypothetical protein
MLDLAPWEFVLALGGREAALDDGQPRLVVLLLEAALDARVDAGSGRQRRRRGGDQPPGPGGHLAPVRARGPAGRPVART